MTEPRHGPGRHPRGDEIEKVTFSMDGGGTERADGRRAAGEAEPMPIGVCGIEHAMIDWQAVASDDARLGVRHKEGPGRQ